MSRIGKTPIQIPENVEVKIEGQEVRVRGPKGALSRKMRPEIGAKIEKGKIIFFPKEETKKTKAFWGLERSLVNNMVLGVTKGYEKKLEIRGLGYKAKVEEDQLVLEVGFTHPIIMEIPEGIEVSVKGNIISVSGIDKEKVTQMAAKIRRVKPPEPYKGKGIRYVGEKVKRKVGKRVAPTEL